MLSPMRNTNTTGLSKFHLDSKSKSLLVLLSLILPKLAIAHPGHGLETGGSNIISSLTSGLMHPLTGLDHLVLALGMGILFTQANNFKRGFIALASGLGLGFLLSLSLNLSVTMIEAGILLSVVLLTVALVSHYFNNASNPLFSNLYTAVTIIFAAFALFHGAAHGLEVPANSLTLGFFTGMMLAMLGLYYVGGIIISALNKHTDNSFVIQRVLAVVGLCAVLFS